MTGPKRSAGRRVGAAAAAKALAGAVLLAGALHLVGCEQLSKLTSPPATRCSKGQHASGDRCCGQGEEWVPAATRCVCLDRSVCGGTVLGAAADSGSRPRRRADAPSRQQPARRHLCVGQWRGELKNSDGDRGRVRVEVTALTAGTIRAPHSPFCGSVEEWWRGGDRCRARLARCSHNGDAILIATGRASDASDCEISTAIALACESGAAHYRRTEDGLAVTATLQEEPPAAGGAPAK